MTPICPYCRKPSTEATGAEIYPGRTDLAGLRFFRCDPCNAHVGRYRDGRPLGSLANPELRSDRRQAHAAFDPLWKSGRLTRTQAYRLLAQKLGLESKDCHIGHFDHAHCEATRKAAAEINQTLP